MGARPESTDLREYLEAEDRLIEELRRRRSEIAERLEALRLRGRRLADRRALGPDVEAVDGRAAAERAEERARGAAERRTALHQRVARAYERAAEAHERAAVCRDRVGDAAGSDAHREAAVRDRDSAGQARSVSSSDPFAGPGPS